MNVLIIIPAYNEEKNLPKLIDDIKNTCPDYDVLIVNDCSTDNTKSLQLNDSITKIDLPSNLGIGGSVQTGYKYAYYNNYDIAVQVDGDGQHDVKYIDLLIKEVTSGADLCLGSRFIDKQGFQSTRLRRIGIKYFSSLIYMVSGLKVTDPTSGFRACNKKAIKLFAKYYPTDYPEPETLVYLKRKKLCVKEVSVVMKERKSGKSSINFIKSIYYFIKVSMAVCFASMAK